MIAGDVTPGEVTITTFRSPCDFMMRPTDTGAIPGADDNHTVTCVGHTGFLSDEASVGVRAALAGTGD